MISKKEEKRRITKYIFFNLFASERTFSIRIFIRIYRNTENYLSTCKGGLDLAVLFTPFTLDRQNTNQVHRDICAGVLQCTPSSEVV